MKRASAVGGAVALGILAYTVTFTYPAFRPLSVPWYLPLESGWRLAAGPGAAADLAMDYYGRLFYGLVAASLVGLVTYAVARRFGRDPGPESFTPLALGANALIFVVMCGLFFAWTLAGRTVEPAASLPFERNVQVGGDSR